MRDYILKKVGRCSEKILIKFPWTLVVILISILSVMDFIIHIEIFTALGFLNLMAFIFLIILPFKIEFSDPCLSSNFLLDPLYLYSLQNLILKGNHGPFYFIYNE